MSNWLNTAFKNRVKATSLSKANDGQEVYVLGWIFRYRDNGGVIFIDLRDVSGLVQAVFERSVGEELLKQADSLRSEFVVAIKGKVRLRGEGAENPKLKTGEIEIQVMDMIILNKSKTIPFSLEEFDETNEELRLEYRYLDLRRERMANIVRKRHELNFACRKYLNEQAFLEVETPLLNKSTPEGARDFLVPSRMNKGSFYALPQSPQLFKQILMVSGLERYYQLAKCFRDEDLRADRQPEFTQLDMEMSFIDQDMLLDIMEKLWASVLKDVFGKEVSMPVPRLSFDEAMRRYGNDKPDTRFGVELKDLTDIAKESTFKIFKQIAEGGGMVKAICVPGGASLSRKDIDELTNWLGKDYGTKGLAWLKCTDNGLESVIAKFFTSEQLSEIQSRVEANTGDIVFFGAGDADSVHPPLSALRLKMGKRFNLIDDSKLNLLWVLDFPLMEKNKEGQWTSMHHPFTTPDDSFLEKLNELKKEHGDKSIEELQEVFTEFTAKFDFSEVKSKSYDMVLNGNEIGGGSIRIHDSFIQDYIFSLLGIDPETANQRFGFFTRALKYGAPPHGGIAFGMDRILMLMTGSDSIRDVITFPKTQKGSCMLSESPSAIDEEQLKDLGLRMALKLKS